MDKEFWLEAMTKLRFQAQDLRRRFMTNYPTNYKRKGEMENAFATIAGACDGFIKDLLEGEYNSGSGDK